MVLPKSMRIKGHRCFDHIHRSGIKYHSKSMTLKIAESNEKILKYSPLMRIDSPCKCAVAISTKVSKRSVVRNRLRRVLHNHLRLRLENNNKNTKKLALISLKPICIKSDNYPLLEECDLLLNQAGLIS